jgi:hypothetical protein
MEAAVRKTYRFEIATSRRVYVWELRPHEPRGYQFIDVETGEPRYNGLTFSLDEAVRKLLSLNEMGVTVRSVGPRILRLQKELKRRNQ